MKTTGTFARNVALLIDADNVSAQSMQGVMERLASYGMTTIRRAYGNWTKLALSGWEERLHEYAIQPVQQFDLVKGKNASDMALLIDAMDILYTKNVATFCLVSSDCDFTPLILRLRADGKQVIVFGGIQAPRSLIKSCTEFVELAGEKKTESVPVKTAKAAKAKPVGSDTKSKGDTELIERLRSAVMAVQDANGWADLSRVGSHARQQGPLPRHSSGAKTLRKIFAALDLFELEDRKNGKGNSLSVRERKNTPLDAPEPRDLPPGQPPEQGVFLLLAEH